MAFKVGKPFRQNLLRKTLYGFCGSYRGQLDLQLSYSSLDALQFKILEQIMLKDA
jgi:hypothetical protein